LVLRLQESLILDSAQESLIFDMLEKSLPTPIKSRRFLFV